MVYTITSSLSSIPNSYKFSFSHPSFSSHPQPKNPSHTTMTLSHIILPILTYFLLPPYNPFIEAIKQEEGFTLDLIHRDSPLSPLHDPSKSRHEMLTNSFCRSILRTQAAKKLSDFQSDLYTIPGEYIMKLSIGSPPVESLAVADTGSDLTWIQCNPCTQCNPSAPIFTPRNSKSYKHLSCKSRNCAALRNSGAATTKCTGRRNHCEYHFSYYDQSYSNGQLSSETFMFHSSNGQTVPIRFAFGCGHDNKITFNGNISGVVGLGGGPVSFVKQLGSTINSKFSYCLVPVYDTSDVPSRINFGPRAVVEGPGVISTPLVHKSPATFYYVTLKSVKVGKKTLTVYDPEIKPPAPHLGNMFIDSGTTLSFLPRGFYESMEAELRSVIKGQAVPDPHGVLSLCYKTVTGGSGVDFPAITFGFIGGDLELPSSSAFYEVAEGVVCLTMRPTDGDSVFGNLAQANLLVGYDLVNNKVSFKSTDCTKH